jgi:hypothetical protein
MKETTSKIEVKPTIDAIIERLNISSGRSLYYALQNSITKVTTENEELARSVESLLSSFKYDRDTTIFDIEYVLSLCEKPTKEICPPSSATLLENPGFFRYYADQNLRYVESDAIGWGCADINTGKAVIQALNTPGLDEWSVAHLLFYPLWIQLVKTCGFFALHSAAAVKDGVVFLFPAYSGTGKSVLSLNLLGDGFKILGDDTVFLHENDGVIEAVGYPEKINLRPDSFSMFPNLKITMPDNESTRKACVDVAALFPGCFVGKAEPNALVMIERHKEESSHLEEISKAESLVKLFKYSPLFVDPGTTGQQFKILSKLTGQSKCFSLKIGTDKRSLLKTINAIVGNI